MSIENNQMTSSEHFSATQNTAMISNRYKNDIGSRLLEYNNQNLTNWYIPSKKEVVLVCEKLLAFSLNCEEYICSTDDPQYGRVTNYVLALRHNVI